MRGRYVLLATGATERSMPIPGWTLPGVMTVGAAQCAQVWRAGAGCNTWIAGQGPLLLLYAVQALRAGGRVAGILDLSDPAGRWGAAWRLPAATRSAGALKGLGWRREIARAGIPWLRASDVRAEGEDRLQRIGFRTAGVARTEPADLLLLHDGVIPSMQMPRAAGCAQEWNAAQRCWQPAVDAWGTTSIANLFVAGDGAGILGAEAAAATGQIVALGIAHACGVIGTGDAR